MNKRCLTTGGKLWQQGHLKSALCSYRMAGLVEKGGELYEAVWDPVYADDRATALETVEALRAIYASRDNFTYRGPGRKYFLSGIAECSDCHEPSPANPEGSTCDSDPLSCGQQHKTFTRKTINGTPYYVCYQCSRGRSAKNLDAFVTGHVLRLLNSSAFRAALSDRAQQEQSHRPNFAGQIAALRARQQEAKAQMKNLASYPGLDPALLAQAITSFDTEIARLQREAGAVASTGLLDRLAGISEADWEELDVAIRSEALKMLYRVIVYRTAKRGPGFDASAIKMVRNKGPRSLAQLPPA
ncbi:hypothetical protein ACFZC3_15130 [Streptomyces sp. NPDC007903]|uniref:hypothetical protein n=1 Tax=Streptomyces sp. NPDC007903 TaxID=3364786 RepID=UPI0036E662B9